MGRPERAESGGGRSAGGVKWGGGWRRRGAMPGVMMTVGIWGA